MFLFNDLRGCKFHKRRIHNMHFQCARPRDVNRYDDLTFPTRWRRSQVSRYRGSERRRTIQHVPGTRSEAVPSCKVEDRRRGEDRRGRVQGRGEEQARSRSGDY